MKTLAQLWSYLKIKFRKVRASDSDGNPLAGGKLYTYSAGTTAPLATYIDTTNLKKTNHDQETSE
jgi:hypothetical protein